MSVRNQPKIHEAKRRPKGRHPLFCFISFIGIYYPLTDIVIVHIVCNPSAHTSMMMILLLFLQKQNLAFAVYQFGSVLSLPD